MTDDHAATQASTRTEALRASPPLFEARTLDRLTRVHPAVVPLIFGPAIVVFAIRAFYDMSVLKTSLGILGGYGIWTLSEYWIHRVVFHFEPDHGLGARLHFLVHGVHHDHPNDPMRLVMPPAVSVPLGALFWLFFAVTFELPFAWAIAAGFFAGYLFYDMLHFALHHAHAKNPVAKRLRELHMRHHFEDDECGFAVSAPWWDMVFGTYSPKARRPRS
jgi:dihydroceramide fatty acyl 2-hydroxylase